MKIQKSQNGFTMIEILVVISIIAVSMTVITISLNANDDRRELNKEARLFEQTLSLGIDESIFKNQELGIIIGERTISYLHFDHQSQLWSFVEEDATYGEYVLPEYFELKLVMEDVEVFLNPPESVETKISDINPLENFDQFEEEEEEEPIFPDIYIFSSGEVTAFELQFHLSDDYDFFYQVSVDDIGQIKFETFSDV